MTNQGTLLKTLTYLGLSFVKSLPWLVIETHGSKLPSVYKTLNGYKVKAKLTFYQICTEVIDSNVNVEFVALFFKEYIYRQATTK